MTSMTETSGIVDGGSHFYAYPYSLSPLPHDLKLGLIAPGTTGILSAASCIGMLTFVLYRFITWRAHYKTFIGYNQYVVLIVNLLLADMLQGVSFMFSFHWISHGGIFAPTRTCFSQGFLLNLGDLASGFFVLGIALHTFSGAVRAKHVSHTTFTVLVIFSWMFALLLTSIGPLMYKDEYYVRAGAWCWVSAKHETERLALHYIWIFLVQFITIILYALIFLHLKRSMIKILPASQSTTHAKVDRAAKLMVLFPIAYIVLTLPLSAGRMWTRANGGKMLPNSYALVAGSMIGSSGLVDCLLYTLTRRSLLRQNNQDSNSTSSSNRVEKQSGSWRMDDFNSSRGAAGITQTRTVTITGDRLSLVSSDDSISVSEISRPSTALGSVDKNMLYPTMTGYTVSPISSQERIVTPGIDGLDPRKGGRKVEISATARAVDAESMVEGDAPSAEEVARLRRQGSAYGMRHAFSLMMGTSTKP